MTYRSILVQAEGGPHCRARLACAVDLADRFGAMLLGLGAEMAPPGAMADPFGAWTAAILEQIEIDLVAAEGQFVTMAGDRPHRWSAVRDLPARALGDAARAADLIVADSGSRGRAPYFSADLGDLVLTAGRPVLIAPPGRADLSARRVLVAWKDSREARRAVADALPFLTAAEEVVVVEACDADHRDRALDRAGAVAEHLARHGVKARAAVADASDDDAGAVLIGQAVRMDADLIVAGGYGRSRLGEWVFGGVTRSLLDQDERFVLLSH